MPSSENTKYATRVLKRLPDGTVGVFYIDVETGETLDSLDGYELVGQGNLEGGSDTSQPDTGARTNTPSSGGFTNFSNGSTSGGGHGRDFYPVEDTIFGKLWKRLTGKEAEDASVGAYIPPAQPTQIPKQTQNAGTNQTTQFPGAMDLGSGLGGTPAELQKAADNWRPYGLDDYQTGYGTNDQYQKEKEQAQKPVSSLDDYKTGYGNPYPSQSSDSQSQTVDPSRRDVTDIQNNSVSISSSGAARAKSHYGTSDPFYGMDAGTKGLLQDVANNTSADTINSGYRDEAHNKEVGGAGGSLHKEGLSFDLNLDGLTDKEKSDVVSRLGFMSSVSSLDVNLGFYSGSNVIHVDSKRRYDPVTPEKTGGLSVMMDRTRGADKGGVADNLPDWAKAGLTNEAIGKWAPVPTPRPDNSNPVDPATGMTKGASGNEIMSAVNPNPSEDKDTAARSILDAAKDPAKTTDDLTVAGTAASYGLSRKPSDAEISDLARTFSGELSPNSLAGVVKGDPAALAELVSMASTYENRLQSGAGDVLRGSHYNSNLKENSTTTDYNYSLYGDALKSALSDYYSGGLAGIGKTDATHYYNPQISSPSWSAAYPAGSMFGDHLFQSSNEYPTDLSKLPSVQAAGAARVNNQYNNNQQLDNSSLTDSAPRVASPISSYYGDDGQGSSGARTNTPSGSVGNFTVNDIANSLGGSVSTDSGDIADSSGNSMLGSPIESYYGSSGSNSGAGYSTPSSSSSGSGSGGGFTVSDIMDSLGGSSSSSSSASGGGYDPGSDSYAGLGWL